MTIIDTIADTYYGDRRRMAMAFAELLNEEARGLAADGVDVIQFDEPAFNVYLDAANEWGIAALHRAIDGLSVTTAVHICYGYGIQPNIEWKATLGSEWRQYEQLFPLLASSRIDQVSLEFQNSRVPKNLLSLLRGKDVLLGVIDVATDSIETEEDVVSTMGKRWSTCRGSTSCRARIAGWHRCRGKWPSPSWLRSRVERGWRANVSADPSRNGGGVIVLVCTSTRCGRPWPRRWARSAGHRRYSSTA